MKKYNYGLTIIPCNKITKLFLDRGFDFIIGMGYWFSSANQWDEAKLITKLN